MTAVKVVSLFFGMAVIGVPLLLGLLSPVAGWIVTRSLPPSAWDGAMLLFAQLGAATATYLVGALALDLPWYAALIVALIVGITSYVRRNPEPLPSLGSMEDDPASWEPDYDESERQDALAPTGEASCPSCGKTFPNVRYRDQHLATKHPA
jgi:hypothetical protein